jgi:hypothetical protein
VRLFTWWLPKAVALQVFSLLPGGARLYYRFLRLALRASPELSSRLVMTPAEFEGKLRQASRHVDNYRTAADRAGGCAADAFEGARVLELGTGWHPAIPIALHLCGARSVRTVDLVDQCRPEGLGPLLDLFLRYRDSGELGTLLPAAREDRLDALADLRASGMGSLDETLALLGIERSIGDARRLPLPSRSVDLFVSNNVLEHIPERAMLGILHEFRRLASEGGVMSHYVDLGDHHSYVDGAITRYNYRRFGPLAWALVNSPIYSQNRFVPSEYCRVQAQAGWNVVEIEVDKGDFDELAPRVPVAECFWDRPRWEWFADTLWLVAVPERGGLWEHA